MFFLNCVLFSVQLRDHLSQENSSVQIDTVEVSREGLCLKFDPLQTSRGMAHIVHVWLLLPSLELCTKF